MPTIKKTIFQICKKDKRIEKDKQAMRAQYKEAR
jgi:hypothetical protein